MIGTVILLQVVTAGLPEAEPPRRTVPAAAVDLTDFALRSRINRKALEGWVPKTGTPAPPAETPRIVEVPVYREPPRRDREDDVEADRSGEIPDSVNSFDQPRPYFYGSWGPSPAPSRPRAHVRNAPRPSNPSPAARPPLRVPVGPTHAGIVARLPR